MNWPPFHRRRAELDEVAAAREELSGLLSQAKDEADAILARLQAPKGQPRHG